MSRDDDIYNGNLIHISGKDIVEIDHTLKQNMNYREAAPETCEFCSNFRTVRGDIHEEHYSCVANPGYLMEVEKDHVCDHWEG